MKKKYKVKITNSAQTDIEEIWQYIAADSIKTATLFINEIEKSIFALDTFPDRYPFIPENQIMQSQYRHIVHKKYRIIYRISDNIIYVLRIIHGYRLFEKGMFE